MPILALLTDEVHEFAPGLLPSPEGPQKGTGNHQRILLLHASHPHTEMFGLYHHRYTKGVELPHNRGGDLVGQALLDLKPTGVDIDQSGQF